VAQTVADLTRADTVSLAFGDRTDAAASARSRRWSLAALSRQIEDVAQVGGRAARYQFLMMTLAPGSGRGIAGVPESRLPNPAAKSEHMSAFTARIPRRNLFGRWQRFPPAFGGFLLPAGLSARASSAAISLAGCGRPVIKFA
jgi:hypothetical protein